MTKETLTEEQFLKDVENHTIEILRDNGIHRHLRFRKDGSIHYGFDIITWPMHLCISGDFGTYVFSRTDDMFGFFAMDEHDFKYNPNKKLSINPGYWGEKLLSIDRTCGYREFSQERFEEAIKYDFEEWEFDSDEQKSETWQDVHNMAINYMHDGEHDAMRAATDYHSSHGHEFAGFWERDCKDFTFQYIWCLYAIVYGIQKYKEEKNKS